VCVCVCVCVCVRARVRVCLRACLPYCVTQSGRQKISQHETDEGLDLLILGKTRYNINTPISWKYHKTTCKEGEQW